MKFYFESRKWVLFFLSSMILGLLIIASEILHSTQNPQTLNHKEIDFLLKENKHLASVVVGTGKRPIYAFIDPLCSMSQDFVETLYKNKLYKTDQYQIFLFLYHLDPKPSHKQIYSIMESDEPEILLKEIMISKNTSLKLSEIPDLDTEEKIKSIEKLAKKIGVDKRPYIISNGIMIGE